MIEDEKEFWLGRSTRPINYCRKDISWLLDKVPLETKFKLAYLVVAGKYKEHGTALSDLKKKRGIRQSDHCNNAMIDLLCDCSEQAAIDIGRGRMNLETVCIGHPCFGITTDKASRELVQSVWVQAGTELSHGPLHPCPRRCRS